MDKEAVLLKTYSVLVRSPIKNAKPLMANIEQLCLISPKTGFSCWLDLLQKNIDKLETEIEDDEFAYGSTGYYFINGLESNIVGLGAFKGEPLNEFVKNKKLLELLYSKFPIISYTKMYLPIAFFIRNYRLQDANTILSAIYKNKYFHDYSSLWEDIVDELRYTERDHYSGGGFVSDSGYTQPKEIQDFCMSWCERIVDEEEQAGAVSHIMRLF